MFYSLYDFVIKYGYFLKWMNFLTEDSTKKRLVEIETELVTLQKQYAGLKQRWQLEKSIIQEIRSTKVTIEQLRFSAKIWSGRVNWLK